MSPLSAEDAKIVTLARTARARNGSDEGAAVRDSDGRSYAATTVKLASLQLSAVQAAVAAAVSSGAVAFEAIALVTVSDVVSDADSAIAAELGVPLLVADLDGKVGGG